MAHELRGAPEPSSARAALPVALPLHPAAAAADTPPCHACSALCCRYYALELDPPEDKEDFDTFRWYLMHGTRSWIWYEDGDWYLQVDDACRFLGPSNECTIYDKRPQICRDYGLPEGRENPDDPLCDYFSQGIHHDLEFRTPEEIEAYAEKFLAQRAAERERRAAAARRGWKKRRRKR